MHHNALQWELGNVMSAIIYTAVLVVSVLVAAAGRGPVS
jgi:hypothetical protein